MEIENIKAQAREDIAKLMPWATALSKEAAVAVYLAGAAYAIAEWHGEPYDNPNYMLLVGEVRNLRNRTEGR